MLEKATAKAMKETKMKQKNTVQARAVKRMMSLEADANLFTRYAFESEHNGNEMLKTSNWYAAYFCKTALLDIYEIVTGKHVEMGDYDKVIKAYHMWVSYKALQA